MNITVKVTQEHIDAGVRVDFQSCPIALALTDKIAGTTEEGRITVGDRVITIGYSPEQMNAWTTRRASAFILKFDERGAVAVKPATFRFTFNYGAIPCGSTKYSQDTYPGF